MGDEWEWKLTIKTGRKGGPGSGNFGHAGRPGQVGGSASGDGQQASGSGGMSSQALIESAHDFSDDKDSFAAARWGNANYKDWTKNLSADERAAIAKYTGPGVGKVNFNTVNNALRGKRERTPEMDPVIDGLDSALNKTKGMLSESIVVHRGVCRSKDCFKVFSGLEVGDSFVDRGFVSTSLYQGRKAQQKVIMRITLPEGSPGAALDSMMTGYSGEVEYLLPRNSRFRVVAKKGGYTQVELDVIFDGIENESTASKQKQESRQGRDSMDREDYYIWQADDIEIKRAGVGDG